MMDREEKLKQEYINALRMFEDREDQLVRNKTKVFQEIDDYIQETDYWAGRLPFGREAFPEAYHNFERESSELEEQFHQKRKKLINQMEDLEQNYRNELRRLDDEGGT